MTGDAPQPGETPRNEGEPWSYTDPGAPWWRVTPDRESEEALAEAAGPRRHQRRRPAPVTPAYRDTPPAFAPEALDAHAAGVQDVTEGLHPPAMPVEAEPEEQSTEMETTAAAGSVAHRKTDAGYAEGAAPGPPDPAAAGGDENTDQLELLDLSDRSPAVPDIMVLPEPLRDRPTVALDRGPVPGQTDSGFVRRTRSRSQATPGVLDPDRAAKIEHSQFWLTDEERAAAGSAWPAPAALDRVTGPDDVLRGKPPARTPRPPHRPVSGLFSLIALGLIAAFFAWVSAAPFWLAVGHGDRGTATVTRCTGSGITQRCSGTFSAADGRFDVSRVTLLGVDAKARATGASAPARMVGPDSRQAYVGGTGPLIHLRWMLGFLLVLLCGYGIAGLTGARRLETSRARRAAVLVSLAGPVLLLVGFLAAGY